MTEMGVGEIKEQIGPVLDRVLAGEEIAVTLQGRLVARFTPAIDREHYARVQAAMADIEARSATLEGDFSWEEMKKLRDFGRS